MQYLITCFSILLVTRSNASLTSQLPLTLIIESVYHCSYSFWIGVPRYLCWKTLIARHVILIHQWYIILIKINWEEPCAPSLLLIQALGSLWNQPQTISAICTHGTPFHIPQSSEVALCTLLPLKKVIYTSIWCNLQPIIETSETKVMKCVWWLELRSPHISLPLFERVLPQLGFVPLDVSISYMPNLIDPFGSHTEFSSDLVSISTHYFPWWTNHVVEPQECPLFHHILTLPICQIPAPHSFPANHRRIHFLCPWFIISVFLSF